MKCSSAFLWIVSFILFSGSFVIVIASVPSTRIPPDAISFHNTEGRWDFTPMRGELGNGSCGLRCWLKNATVTIPDQSIVKAGFNFSLEEMSCRGVDLQGINSSFVPPTKLVMHPYGVGTHCSGRWAFREVIWPHLSGSGAVSVLVGDSSLHMEMDIVNGTDGLANYTKATFCSTDIKILSINFTGGIIDEILNLLKGFVIDQVQSGLNDATCTELTKLIDTNLTEVIQEVDVTIKGFFNPPQPIPPPVPKGMVRLVNNSIVEFVQYTVQEVLSPSGILSIRKLVDRFTNNTGAIELHAKELESYFPTSFSFPIGEVGNITLGLIGINASGLDTWGALDLTVIGDYWMNLHSAMDRLDINVSFFVNVSADADFIHTGNLYEEGKLTLKLKNNKLNTSAQIALKKQTLKDLKPDQYVKPGCIIGALYDANITQLIFGVSVEEILILAEDGDLENDVDALIDNVLALFTTSYGPAIPPFFNGFAGLPIRNEINGMIANVMEMNMTCPPPEPVKDTVDYVGLTFGFGGAGLLSVILTIALIVQERKRRKKSKPERAHLLEPDAYDENGELILTPVQPPSLVLNQGISAAVRYGVTLLLLANIGLFITSNTAVGASVIMVLNVGTEEIVSPPLFTFGLMDTVRDMWRAKVYPLAILIALFSGIWPYVKLVAMLICWLSPVTLLKAVRRERLLMALDMLGKWSLIDTFVLVLMMVAFRFHIASGPLDQMPLAVANVYVEPEIGFYTFLLATMSSLILTHLILYYHVQSEAPPPSASPLLQRKQALSSGRLFSMPYVWTGFGKHTITLLLFVTLCLISVGVSVTTFNFEFKGAAAYLMELLNERNVKSHSVIELGATLPESSMHPNSFGVRWIQFTYFLFVLIVPILHLCVLLFLWLVPLTPKAQRRVFTLTEVLNAWSSVEVFVVSIIAALLEIRQFTHLMVGDKCDMINGILEKYFSDVLDGDPQCFDVIATLDDGCWILFGACIIYLCVAGVVMKTCHSMLHDFDHRISKEVNYTEAEEENRSTCSRAFVSVGRTFRLIRETEVYPNN